MNLTDEQMNLLRAMAEVHQSGIRGKFVFARLAEPESLLIYGGRSIIVDADNADLVQLEKENLITLGRTSNGDLCGKVTKLGIDMTTQADSVEGKGGDSPDSHAPTSATARGRGFPADAEDHGKVVRAVDQIGKDWLKNLPQLCKQLQGVGAAFPDKWAKDECVDSWDELADSLDGPSHAKLRERLAKYIRYRTDWVRDHPAD